MRNTTWISVAAVTVLAASGALAQSGDVTSPTTSNTLDCVTNFRALDRNGNGILEAGEVGPNNSRLPTNISSARDITEEQFVRACAPSRTLPQGNSQRN